MWPDHAVLELRTVEIEWIPGLLALQWSDRFFFGGFGGDPGSHRGFWGAIGGSTDAYGAYLPTAGEYGSPGSFVPQARPLKGRVPIWMCKGEAGVLGA